MRRKKLEEVIIPGFLPEATEIRSDLLDYAVEIDWFDEQLGKMVSELKKNGELDNTIVVVTSDNGMPFPRAKANNYEYGIHLPLAVRWGDSAPGGRIIDDLISCVDFAPTFLEAAGITQLPEMTGKSFLNLLVSNEQGLVDSSRRHILTGRERHTHARPNNFGYPVRAIRTPDFLYIWNLKPDRWPAGDPINSDDAEGYYDIDASPTKSFLIKNRANPAVKKYFLLAVAKRPAEELYNIKTDPACLENLAARSEYHLITRQLRAELEKALIAQADPRIVGYGDIFESYPRYSSMRDFAGFKKQGEYNLKYRMEKKQN